MKQNLLQKESKKSFLQGLSLRQRIPILIFLLLGSVITIFSFISYLGFRNLELNSGRIRLISLVTHASSMIEESVKDAGVTTLSSILPETFQYYLKRDSADYNKVSLLLNDLLRQDGSSTTIELRDSSMKLLLSVEKHPGSSSTENSSLTETRYSNPMQTRAGKFYQKDSSIFYPIIVPLTENNKPLGFIINYRKVKITSAVIRQFSKLAGGGATLYVGNDDGTLWTDLLQPVKYHLSLLESGDEDVFTRKQGQNEMFIGAVKKIPGTPWLAIIEFPYQSLLQTSNQFLHWLITTGLLLSLLGMLTAWLISRYLTQPLKTLIAATNSLADGNSFLNLKIHGDDEVGRLESAFNAMAAKLKKDQKIMQEQVIEARQLNDHLRHLSAHMEKIREEERLHIAREMHDELGQLLTGFKMDVFLLKKRLGDSLEESVKEKINSLETAAGEAMQFVRKLASELRLGPLEDLGLIAAIEWYSKEFSNRYQIPVVFNRSINTIRIPTSSKIGLFRICQESLTNIVRHAKASRINVCLDVTTNYLTLTIEDNGQGFIIKGTGEKNTLGLLGMKERAIMIGATLNINSTPGKGTIVKITLPISDEVQVS